MEPRADSETKALKGARGVGAEDELLDDICALLRASRQLDFAGYKRGTLRRRVKRRAGLCGAAGLEDYLLRLRTEPGEAEALGKDLLVGVTGFFRDPADFAGLRGAAYPELLAGRSPRQPLRVWVAGCSTGEEAYSHVIGLLEHAADASLHVFATDLCEDALAHARAALYEEPRGLSTERLGRWFAREAAGWRATPELRERCSFARHDVLRDPALSAMDLVSCRNLLIYFEPGAQKEALSRLRRALRPGGFLLLGPAESGAAEGAGFRRVPGAANLFVRDDAPEAEAASSDKAPPRRAADWLNLPERRAQRSPARTAADYQEEINRILLGHYTPPGVLVDDSLNVLQTHGPARRFLELPSGGVSSNLMRMANEDLAFAARAAIQRAKTEDLAVKRLVRLRLDGRETELELEALPVKSHFDRRRRYLLLFAPASRPSEPAQLELGATAVRASAPPPPGDPAAERDDRLAAAKEELQAANEELLTVNDELSQRNRELKETNEDFANLLSSVQIPILMLDSDARLRRYTPAAEEVFGVRPPDVGRRLASASLAVKVPGLERLLEDVMRGGVTRELEVRDARGRWYSLSVRPFRTQERRVEGAVLSLSDVTERREGLRAVEAARDYAESIVDAVAECLVLLDAELRVTRANRAFHRFFRVAPDGALGRPLASLDGELWRSPELARRLRAMMETGEPFSDWELEVEAPRLGARVVAVSGRVLKRGDERDALLVIEDVTPRRQAAEAAALRKSEARQRDFVANVSHELMTPITAIKGYSESLLDGALEFPRKALNFTQIIERHADRLAQLVEDILELSRFEAGGRRASEERTSLRAAAERAAQSFAPGARGRAPRATVVVRVPDELRVGLSAGELSRVLQILCENAVKYARGRPRVALDARVVGRRAVVSVRDNGIGIPKHDLARVFDRFYRAENARAGTKRGTGLGLSIAKSILASRGCRIWAESVVGKGTTFFFTLPLH